MRARLWSAARCELCYSSRRTSGWWALRFSNERSPGMRLRAPSQSLGESLWSLGPPRALFLNVALKSTWGFGGKHNARSQPGWGVRWDQEHRWGHLIGRFHRWLKWLLLLQHSNYEHFITFEPVNRKKYWAATEKQIWQDNFETS